MSRVGKKPVTVPSGVTATVEGQTVKMKGPKGQLQFVVHDDVDVKFEDGAVKVAPRHETNRARALYGTARAQIANLVDEINVPRLNVEREAAQLRQAGGWLRRRSSLRCGVLRILLIHNDGPLFSRQRHTIWPPFAVRCAG